MKKRRLAVSVRQPVAMHVTRVAIAKQKLVYVITTNKRFKYKKGRSLVAYIGMTRKGVRRLAQSAASKARAVLALRGVRELHVHVVTCRSRQNVKTWAALERALLLAFKARHGEVPRCNILGKRMKERDEFDYFRRRRIEHVLDELK